jgi:hypothetical protein
MDSATCLPIPPSLHVEALLLNEGVLTVLASAEASDAPCPRPRHDMGALPRFW